MAPVSGALGNPACPPGRRREFGTVELARMTLGETAIDPWAIILQAPPAARRCVNDVRFRSGPV
jgi:hypothetical protein